MRFSVVEYTTKTNQIWRHTPDRPNYLCDPRTEIDPTSFGCYTSALAGEHIPLTGLIVGDIYPLSATQRLRRKLIKRFKGNWPTDYSLDYLHTFNVIMVVYQISDGHEVTTFTKRLKKTFPQTLVLGVATQPYGILRDHWLQNEAALADCKEFLSACDRVITIVESTQKWWQELTKTPVMYLPQPYPVEHALQSFVPRTSKQKVLYVAGDTNRANILQGHIVARELQKQFPDYTIAVTQIPGIHLSRKELRGTRYTIHPFEEWQQHLKSLGATALVINTDHTYTRGRVQVDCAAVGTPSIGANSDGQNDLFHDLPATTATPISELVAQGRKLLSDEAFYTNVTTKARARLTTYTYEQAAQRINKLYYDYAFSR